MLLDSPHVGVDLHGAEVPAVTPIDLGIGSPLAEIEGIFYAAFPKVRGRMLDELDDETLRRIGRLIGRMHAVGAAREAPHRTRFTVEERVHTPLDILVSGGVVPGPLAGRYRDVALRIADAVAKPLAG